MTEEHGIRGGLTNYGDRDFAEYLRSSFARSMGLSKDMLRKPIVGIAETYHFPYRNSGCRRGTRYRPNGAAKCRRLRHLSCARY